MVVLSACLSKPSTKTVQPWQDDLVAWSCAASIRHSRKQKDDQNKGFTVVGTGILHPLYVFRRSASFIFMCFWKALKYNNTELVVKGETLYEAKSYMYKDGHFVAISDVEIRKIIELFIEKVYGEDIPRTFCEQGTIVNIIQALVIEKPITQPNKDQYVKDGYGFKNYFVPLRHNPHVKTSQSVLCCTDK